ncbi:MAG: glycoside hydrolase family 43 protein [Clostridia bacterium]|nr:glycoside hydrolase family 43 protein [Clostridia bacterium]
MGDKYQNPVCSGADPFVLLNNGTYYLYSTNSPDGFRVFTSSNMADWTDRGYCLRADDVMGDKWFWAPEVLENDGKFYMVYVANEHLGIAVADSPLGPFIQKEKKWLNDINEIDGHFFVDDDGTVYLYFVRFDNGNVIWCAKMNDDMLSYDHSTARFLFRAEDEWELKDCSVVEGPFVLKHNNKYYLTYSANHTRCEDYAVGCAVSDNPMGPFKKVSYNPILKKNDTFNGTGHHSFTTSKDGSELVCVYHARPFRDTTCPRMTCIDRTRFIPDKNGGDDILVIDGPTFDSQRAFD